MPFNFSTPTLYTTKSGHTVSIGAHCWTTDLGDGNGKQVHIYKQLTEDDVTEIWAECNKLAAKASAQYRSERDAFLAKRRTELARKS